MVVLVVILVVVVVVDAVAAAAAGVFSSSMTVITPMAVLVSQYKHCDRLQHFCLLQATLLL